VRALSLLASALLAFSFSSCLMTDFPNLTPQFYLSYSGHPREEIGSWLGRVLSGRRTASGEPYDPMDLTAAHRREPIYRFLKVTNPRTGRSVIVRVIDRVPRRSDCDIMLSWRAARLIGLIKDKIGRVIVEPVEVTWVRQFGVASWYGRRWHGRSTANMEVFNMHDMTAAHRFLPFNTYVRVTNLKNGRSVIVRINDRGPFLKGRVIDLSYRAAEALGMIKVGTAYVMLEVLPDELVAEADSRPRSADARASD